MKAHMKTCNRVTGKRVTGAKRGIREVGACAGNE